MSLVDYASYPELEPTTYEEEDVEGEWFTVGRNGRSISMNQLVVEEDEIEPIQQEETESAPPEDEMELEGEKHSETPKVKSKRSEQT
eukprot:UN05683